MITLAIIFAAAFVLALFFLSLVCVGRRQPPPFGGIPYERDDRPDYLKFGDGPYGRKK